MVQLTDPHSDPVVAAIERVLGAERDGEARLRDDRQQAEALLAAARAEAAAIARRADARISKLHAAYLQKIQQDIEKLAGPHTAATERADSPYEQDALSDAARRIATKLTSET
jgi:vacuolar-type H+-ATPase subunit H